LIQVSNSDGVRLAYRKRLAAQGVRRRRPVGAAAVVAGGGRSVVMGDEQARVEVHAGGQQVDGVLRQTGGQRSRERHVIRPAAARQYVGERRDVVARQSQRLDLRQLLLLML